MCDATTVEIGGKLSSAAIQSLIAAIRGLFSDADDAALWLNDNAARVAARLKRPWTLANIELDESWLGEPDVDPRTSDLQRALGSSAMLRIDHSECAHSHD